MLDRVVTDFVDAAFAQLRRQDAMRCPGKVPDAMRDDSIVPSDDWVGWKPIPSTVTDSDLDTLEQETGLPFPPLYRDFLQYRHFVSMECGIRFEPHLCHNWREKLRAAYFHSWSRERILDIGLLPFGDEKMLDAGPVCFDTRRRMADGDCPVVFWDHEWVDTNKEIQPMFSSCRRMFECLSLVATTDFDDEIELLPQKRAFMARFLSLDPEGAGGSAKNYWTLFDG